MNPEALISVRYGGDLHKNKSPRLCEGFFI